MTGSSQQTRTTDVVEMFRQAISEAEQKIRNLETGVASAQRIGVAIGIVMAQYGINEDEAFARLRTVSQHTHRKIRDLADDVVLTGALPDA